MQAPKNVKKNSLKTKKPQENSTETSESIVLAKKELIHKGPIPHPSILKGYADIDETFPNRIITMAENNLKHIQDMDKEKQKNEFSIIKTGQILAFIITLVCVLGGFCLLIFDKTWTGSTILVLSFISFLSSMIINHTKEKETK